MSELSKLAEQLQDTRATVEAPPPTEIRTKAGHDLRRAEAKQALPVLTKKFLESFRRVGFPIMAMGARAQEYGEAVAKVTDSVTVDFSKIFSGIHEMVAASMGKAQEFGPNQYSVLLRELRQVAVAHDVAGLDNPAFQGNVYVGPGATALADVVDSYIEKATGTNISGPAIESAASRIAEGLRTEASVVPVVVYNINKDTAEKVGPRTFQKKYLVVEVPDDFSEEFVIETLKDVKKLIQSKEN